MPSALDDLTLLLIGSLVATMLVALLLRGGREQAGHALLLGGDLVALAIARSLQSGVIAFVAELVGVLLSVGPSLLDFAEHALYRRDRLRGALRVAKVRELLTPGAVTSRRRRGLEHQWAARSGDVGRAVTELERRIAATRDADEARSLRESMVLLLLTTNDVDGALAVARRYLGIDAYRRSPELASAVGAALSARGHLGPALQLLVLVEAQAAAAVGQRGAQLLATRARLAFVAGAGMGQLVEQLLADRSIREQLLSAEVARLREVVRDAPASAPETRAVATQVAQRMLDLGARAAVPTRRRAPITLLLVAITILVAIALALLHLDRDELGLARAGALYGPAVAAGEPWRLVSAAWLHASPGHLVANMYGLFVLGRTTEEVLGWPRLVVVYAASAFGGALASLWADRGLSVGASGAIMGLLAALTVVVFVRRRNFHPAVRRMLLGNLLFLGAIQAFLGWQLPLIDSAAHLGGFSAGLVATLGLHPADDASLLGRRLAIGAAVLYAVMCLATLPLVATRRLDQTLLRLPTHEVELNGTHLQVPRAWRREADHLFDPYLGIELSIEHKPDGVHILCPQADDPRVRGLLDRISTTAR